ncbi:MAG: PAS domain S-box protein [Alphaproteobacteria bacterium]|nr:PAS domain S-box protein [Alphaproteobacteria bacterium]
MLLTTSTVFLAVMVIVLSFALIKGKRSAVLYRRSFDTASVGVVHVAMDGTWLRMNDKMLAITGYPRDELLGMRFADITVEEDLPENQNQNTKLRNGEIESYTLQKRYRRKDERIVWVNLSVTLLRRKDGSPDYYITMVEDIDDLKRAEFSLLEQETRFRAFWDNSPFNQTLKDTQGRLVLTNESYRRNYGLLNESLEGQTSEQAHGADWGSNIDDFDREVLRTRTTRTSDFQVTGTNGEELSMRITKFPIHDRDGMVVGVGGVSYDITSQVRAAQEMRESEERFRATFEQAAVGIAHVAIDGQWLRINQRYCDLVGYTEDELRELTFRDISYGADLTSELQRRSELIAEGTGSYTREKRYIRKDGSLVWVEVTASITEQSRHRAPYLIVVAEDISERKRAERALADRLEQQSVVMAIGQLALAEEDVSQFLGQAADIVAQTMDVDVCLISRRLHETNDYLIIAGSEGGKKFVGMDIQPQTSSHERSFNLYASKSVIFDNSDPANPEFQNPITDVIGSLAGITVVIAEGDTVYGILAVHSRTARKFTNDDVTFLQSVANVLSTTIVRSRISAELIDRERTLNAILDNAADGIVVSNSSGGIMMSNDAAEEIFGYSSSELQEMQIRDLIPATYPSKSSHAAHDTEIQTSAREMVGLRKDDTSVPIDIAMSEFAGPEGSMHIALIRDITEQKSLQSQLIQASKLATVGEMAAGIAHELNQPLNIMRMAADNVLIRMDAGSADMDYARDNLTLVSEQAGRMGKIILHMRVFSRQDTSDFVIFDPVRPVRNACELMRRQLQLESIELKLDAQDSEFLVDGSESQLEQVIINMITNARDAILATSLDTEIGDLRGQITVTTSNGPNDQLYMVHVSDTGGGIPKDVLARVFDPFFTTKEVGVGTGLGLSVSYGIISSMGGTITAHNTEVGCEMCIELPRASNAASEDEMPKSQAPGLQ